MKNKILIRVIVPTLMSEYEIFIPVNERIVKVKELLIKGILELSEGHLMLKKSYSLIDPDEGTIYDSRIIVRDTNIINNKRVILF